jgi:multidrug efflux pump subunit AcrB
LFIPPRPTTCGPSARTSQAKQIQDEALFKVRPMFASLPGVSAPPPFGGNQRTIVVRADPQRLQAYHMSPEEVVAAIAKGNEISPSGTVTLDGKTAMAPVNSVVKDPKDLEQIPIRIGTDPTVYVRDIGHVEDTQDIPMGYELVNGKRSVYILVTKRADASTLSVVTLDGPSGRRVLAGQGEGLAASLLGLPMKPPRADPADRVDGETSDTSQN